MWDFRHQIPCSPRQIPVGRAITEDSANLGCTRRAAEAMFGVHELLLARSQPGIGVSVTDRDVSYLRCC